MKPEVVTVRNKIRDVRKRWFAQYHTAKGWPPGGSGLDKSAVFDRLSALDLESCSAEDVTKAIGNASWTDLHCHGCDTSNHPAIVVVGELPDYESSTVNLCFACAREAARVIDAVASVPVEDGACP